MFIRTKIADLTIGPRTYPAGSVVEVHKTRRKQLIELGHAEDHPGPAFEPEADQADADQAEADQAKPKGKGKPKG